MYVIACIRQIAISVKIHESICDDFYYKKADQNQSAYSEFILVKTVTGKAVKFVNRLM